MTKSIIKWLGIAIQNILPPFDTSDLPGKSIGKLKLTPQELLEAINAFDLAEWALSVATSYQPRPKPKGPGGRPPSYRDSSILLMAVVQAVWRKSYEQIIDMVRANDDLALTLGFTQRHRDGKLASISKGQYWERRQQLGIFPWVFFFMGLVIQLIRLGAITGRELMVDATLVKAWYWIDPDATWQRYRGKSHLFGYKVHAVVCRQACLPVLVAITPAHVNESQLGWLLILLSAILYGFQVWTVYADAAYADHRMFRVCSFLGAHPAINYNMRRSGKRKIATLFFLEQWKRLVMNPRKDIERHFAWAKRYFGLKFFQCFTYDRVSQYVLLTYIAILAVALAAQRYQRPDLLRSRAMVIAQL